MQRFDQNIQPHRSNLPWYFACSACTAKWFSETKKSCCPRCATPEESAKRIEPPWWKPERDKASAQTGQVQQGNRFFAKVEDQAS